MKNSIIFLLAVITAFLLSSCHVDENQTSTPKENITVNKCHTELISTPIQTSVTAKELTIASGQFVNGVVEDHAKKNTGYTKEMFLLDNPEIAKRQLVKKLDPCDSTKIKYVSLPLYPGDVILLRLPFRLDTVPGNSESVVWKSPKNHGHIKQVVDMVSGDRIVQEFQNIDCENTFQLSPCPPPVVIEKPNCPEQDGSAFYSNTPWWVWLILIALGLIIFLSFRKQKAYNNSEDVFKVIREESEKTRHHVSGQSEKTRTHVTHEVQELRIDVANKLGDIASNSGKTNDLLAKILENGAPKKPDDEQK